MDGALANLNANENVIAPRPINALEVPHACVKPL